MNQIKTLISVAALSAAVVSHATLVTDPNDPRNWQGATVGTFAQMIYGADTLANRTAVVTSGLLDDSHFDSTGFTAAHLLFGAQGSGTSLDLTGTGSYDYVTPGPANAGDLIDEHWIQTSGTIGGTVWDLGGDSSYAAIMPTIDHGPLPQEALESTVYLSNDQINWVQASTVRVSLEGFHANHGIVWDGFTFVVTTPNHDLFRYASIIHGGPGSYWSDGDNEINGVLGLRGVVPEPSSLMAFGSLAAMTILRRRRSK